MALMLKACCPSEEVFGRYPSQRRAILLPGDASADESGAFYEERAHAVVDAALALSRPRSCAGHCCASQLPAAVFWIFAAAELTEYIVGRLEEEKQEAHAPAPGRGADHEPDGDGARRMGSRLSLIHI